jgi:hypothetical protein
MWRVKAEVGPMQVTLGLSVTHARFADRVLKPSLSLGGSLSVTTSDLRHYGKIAW